MIGKKSKLSFSSQEELDAWSVFKFVELVNKFDAKELRNKYFGSDR